MFTTSLLIILLLLSVLTNIFLYKILSVQIKKIKKYEQFVIDSNEWMESVRNSIRTTYFRMKKIDDRDIFFKDDEVGIVFTELLNLLKRLNDKIEE